MLRRTLSLSLIFCSTFAAAQKNREELMSVLSDVTAALRENPAKHGIQPYAMPDYKLVLLQPGQMVMNAVANPSTRVIQISPDLVDTLKNDKGELAFVIAHELGHLQDANCAARGAAQRLTGQALKRMCESTADFVGLQYLMAAGYNPYDAAGLLGKLLMFNPQESSVAGILVNRFMSDHPVDIDRIKHLKAFSNQVCIERADICVQYMN